MAQQLITLQEARERVLAAVRGPLAAERVEIAIALDRVLATDLTAHGDVPPFACSAMDGYAVDPGPAGRTLRVIGESRAGAPYAGELRSGQAIRISTGAALPRAARAVIRQEDVIARDGAIETAPDTAHGATKRTSAHADGAIETTAEIAQGANVRAAGSDVRAGETVLRAGTVLGPHALAAAIAAGAGTLEVHARPRVAILCTGDELRPAGEPLQPGEIHNSNGPMLAALCARCGAAAAPPVGVPDDATLTRRALAHALEHADVLIVSGGVSVGPHDHVKPALERLGVQQSFWGVALQPGKPTWFGLHEGTLVFGLPGNPVSAAVTFTLLVWPALLGRQGAPPPRALAHALPREAALAAPVRRNPERERAILARLSTSATGSPLATATGVQESHRITSMLAADALAIVPRGAGEAPTGEIVILEPMLR